MLTTSGRNSLVMARDFKNAKHWRYRSAVLVRTLELCANLRDTAKLRTSMRLAAQLCFPALRAAVEAAMRDPSVCVPSPAVLHRARYWLDAAFMIYMRSLKLTTPSQTACGHDAPSMSPVPHDTSLSSLLHLDAFRYCLTDASKKGGLLRKGAKQQSASEKGGTETLPASFLY